MNSPVEFTITRQSEPGQQPFIRLLGVDKLTVKFRIEMSLEDFAAALMGQEITARFSEGAEG